MILRNLREDQPQIPEVHCSRERSRAAWKVTEEYLMPLLEREKYQLSSKCLLHPSNDIFRDQEEHKIHVDINEWRCGYCKKIFRAEKYLDQHFDNRHLNLLNVVIHEKTYESKPWYREKFPSQRITIKDFLRLSLTNPLEMLLDVKSNPSSFHIRLTYKLSDASPNEQLISKGNECNKRRKIDENDDLKKHGNVEGHEFRKRSSNELGDNKFGCLTFPLEKVSQCCSLIIQCYRTSIYIGGRYLKYSRKVSQTRWIIDDERMGEASVEEIVGGTILPICQGDSYKFHAAGREDIDVRMLGTGRPFLVEIQNARQVLSEVLIKDIEKKINSTETKYVRVKNLKEFGSQGWALMREGESEKQKQYVAVVWISRPLDDNDVQTVSSLKDIQILQKTPVRVLHRRSSLVREKIIHWMKIERIAGSSQYFLLHLCTQAGTYIKEFVHGDLGRTHPSIGSILGCRAEILQLDVTDVKMDSFQS